MRASRRLVRYQQPKSTVVPATLDAPFRRRWDEWWGEPLHPCAAPSKFLASAPVTARLIRWCSPFSQSQCGQDQEERVDPQLRILRFMEYVL